MNKAACAILCAAGLGIMVYGWLSPSLNELTIAGSILIATGYLSLAIIAKDR